MNSEDSSKKATDLSPEKLALLVMRMKKKKAAEAAQGSGMIPRRADEAAPPLSFAQQRLWLLDRLEPGNSAYNMAFPARLLGSLDRDALARALAEILRRHESLRTTFTTADGVPVQVIAPPAAFSLPWVDLSALPQPVAREEGDRLLAADAKTPFDLERSPLCRLALVRLEAGEHLLLVNMHHIVSDGWSLGLFFNELSALYEAFLAGRPSPLPEPPIQYADFAVWQREWLAGPVLEEQLAYWRGQLAGSPPVLELPTDKLRPAVQTHRGEAVPYRLPESLTLALRELSRREGVSMFMTLLAGFNLLLSRLTGQEDVVVGSPSAGRRRVETEGLIGLFLNTLVLRTDLSGVLSFKDLLARVKTVVLGAYRYQEVPFEKLLEELQPERVLSRSPFFQVLFNMVTLPDADLSLPGLRIEQTSGAEPDSKFDFTFYVQEQGDAVHVNLVYNVDLFDRARMEELLRQFELVVSQAVAAPTQSLAALSLVTPEARLLLPDPAVPLGGEWMGSVHAALGRAAARCPDRPAVVGWREGEVWTYAELDARANQLAHFLRAGGVRTGDVVAVWAHRGASLVWAVLGTLKAGAAFMVLDPAYPPARLVDHLRIGQPRAWLVVEGAVAPPAEVAQALPPLSLELPPLPSMPAAFLADLPSTDPAVPLGPEDAACITFTSGSTGKPKGVIGRHGPLSHFYPWMGQRFGLSESDRFGMLSALSHDPLQRDLFTPLWFGASLAVPEPDRIGAPGYLAEWIRRQGVSVLHLTPAMMELVTLSAEETPAGERDLPSLRCTFVVGDLLKKSDVARLQRLAPGLTCINLYGSTETQRSVGYFAVPRPETPEASRLGREVLPLGRGMEDVQLLILNRASELAGIGEVGEIHVRSRHLARGYLGDEALTAGRFLANPFGSEPEDRVYRTGDLGRYLPDGNAEFAGRADFQVKLRGFRIELGEIEAALAGFPGVKDCVVVLREDRPGDRRLAAYLVASPAPPARDLHAFLARRLPDYMVPADFVTLAALPLTATGKVDRLALPAPPREESASVTEFQETHPVEELLAGIWSDLLGIPRARRHDNFFELGGHSLLATRMMSRVRDALGVELPLRALFEEPTVAGLAEVIERARRVGLMPPAPPIVPVPRGGDLPLSFSQRRLWFLDHLEPGSFAYNLAGGVRLEGDLDAGAFARCLTEIARRHESLRTRFETVEGEPVAVIDPPAPFPLSRVDLSSLPAEDRERRVLELATEEARRPFDLAAGPLLRCTLVCLGEREHALLIAMHHIVSDGWSLGVLVRELGALYPAFVAGGPSPLPELPIQYADFAHWQRNWLRGEVLEGQLAYWRRHLAGAPPVLELPTDRPRPAVRSQRGGQVFFSLDAELSARLEAVSRRLGVTPFMTFLGAFAVLLSRYSGQRDLVIGTPIANRNQSETEDLIGFFANTLVLRVNLEELGGDPPFADLARKVREEALGVYAHQDLPFEKLVDELQPERNLSHSPIFQVMLALQNVPLSTLELPGLTLSSLPVESGRSQFDLNLSLLQADGGLMARLDFDTDLFDAATAERLVAHWRTLLGGIADAPGTHVAALPLLSAAERRELLLTANATEAEIPDRGMHELFEATAARRPASVAITFEGTSLTYAEVNARANRLAHALRRLGVGPEVLVGLCVERCPDMLVGLLGILKAGGAYVPLDPSYPSDRLAYVLDDGEVPVLLTQAALLGDLAGLQGHSARVIEIDGDAFAGESAENPPPLSGPENRAYVIYTSGSTGRPKGVAVRHRGAVNFLASMARRPGLEPHDVMVAVTTISFDIAVLELYLPLMVGARIELVSRETAVDGARLATLIAESGATVMQATPATWRLLLEADWTGSTGLKVLCGGEALPPDLAAQLLARVGSLWNVYGPTETTVWSTVHRVEADGDERRPVPIGKPIANTAIYLLDRNLEPVPPGAAGELYIGGEGLARGYVGRPDLTAERFVPDPYGHLRGTPGSRVYRTGDLARSLRDGSIDFLGRIDHQVKIRGFRIELGEIESVLAAEPAVRECAVVVREDVPGTKRLAAYLVPDGEMPEVSELRATLSAKLPEYMVPQLFMPLPTLPLTPNGKVDRRALVGLPAPEEAGAADREYVAPRNPVEESLAAVWAEVLHLERVGVTDNFFELGGDSILTIQVVARCKKRGLRFVPRQLFQHQTISALAAVIEVETARQEPGTAGPLPFTPAQRLLLATGSPAFERWSDAVLLELPAGLTAEAVEQTLAGLVARHDALRLRFTPDPWAQQVLDPATAPLAVTRVAGLLDAAAAEEIRNRIDLATQPLQIAVSAAEKPVRLLIAAHPLVLDKMSFPLLVEELASAAPVESASFRSLASSLAARHARTTQSDAKIDPETRTEGAAGRLWVTLGQRETSELLDDVPRAYGNTVEEVLLAALTESYLGWSGARDLTVEVEGGVRDSGLDGLDASRTIGCLAIPHPVHLERKDAPGDLLKGVKEWLRHSTRASLDDAAAGRPATLPEVGLSWLGRLDAAPAGATGWRGEWLARRRDPGALRRHLLDVEGSVSGGCLRVAWTFSERIYRRDAVQALADRFLRSLGSLIQHCQSSAGGFTPSDFPGAGLSQEDLDDLLAELS